MNVNFQTFKTTDKVRIIIGSVTIRAAIRDLQELFSDDQENYVRIASILNELDAQRIKARQDNILTKKPINTDLPEVLKVKNVNVCLLLVYWEGVRKVPIPVSPPQIAA